LLALGSNLPWGDLKPRAVLQRALENLERAGAATVEARSDCWRTEAWPDPSDPPFANMVVAIRTPLGPVELLKAAHEIEAAFGRARGSANAPRTLDIDIVDFDGLSADFTKDEDGADLALPHPRMHERAFVLAPLLDVAPAWRHPRLGVDAETLFSRLPSAERASVRRLGAGEEV
jgi:2-amino-4-hydroxy-6-hydroxymethyldihydropteridine diphosphokinase